MSTPAGDRLTENKLVIRRIYEQGYDQQDPSVFEMLYAPGFVHHSKVIFDVAPDQCRPLALPGHCPLAHSARRRPDPAPPGSFRPHYSDANAREQMTWEEIRPLRLGR
jgi:hypothetical protein